MDILAPLRKDPHYLGSNVGRNYSGILCTNLWYSEHCEQRLAIQISSPPERYYIGWHEGNEPYKELHETPLWFRMLYCQADEATQKRFRLHRVTSEQQQKHPNITDLFYMSVLPTDEIEFSMEYLKKYNKFYVNNFEIAQKVQSLFTENGIVAQIELTPQKTYRIDIT